MAELPPLAIIQTSILTRAQSFFQFKLGLPNQVAVPNERATTHIAFVVLAGRMRAYVYGELRFTGKCHGASVAAERLFRYVGPPIEQAILA